MNILPTSTKNTYTLFYQEGMYRPMYTKTLKPYTEAHTRTHIYTNILREL
jgi:hypothetical protein